MSDRDTAFAGLRMLVVEDEYLIVRELRRILASAGCADIAIAGNLADAERLVLNSQLDGAVLDIKLGERDVYDLAMRLEREGVPIVFLTGYAIETVPEKLAHIPLIQKPFARKRLLKALHRAVLGDRAPGRE